MCDHYQFSLCRGVGCIFVEMLSGKPLFPGIKGVYDQLNKIWNVSEKAETKFCGYYYIKASIYHDLLIVCFQILGTPSESTWSGVSSFPEYKPCKCTTLVTYL